VTVVCGFPVWLKIKLFDFRNWLHQSCKRA